MSCERERGRERERERELYKRHYSDFHNDCLFLAQKKTILIPNAENKDRSDVLWLRNLNLSFFYGEKKDSHYGNQSIVESFLVSLCMYIDIHTHTYISSHTHVLSFS